MKGVIAWIVAAGAGIVPPILAISLWRSIEGDLPFRIVTNTGFDAFQISIVPILAGLGLVTLIVEGLGYTLRRASFGLGAIILTFLGLEACFMVIYDKPFSPILDVGEAVLLFGVFVGAVVFAWMRRIGT